MADPARQRWIDDQVVPSWLKAERDTEQEKRRPGRPGLRAAGRRIRDRILGQAPGVAAESLGKSAGEDFRRFQNSGDYVGSFFFETVTTQTPGNERVVERPDRAHVVSDRVVPRFALRERAHAPSGEQPRAKQMPRERAGLRLIDDSAPQEVPIVRSERVHLAAVGIKCDGEILAVFDP